MQWMINLKTPREIERMKPASRIVAEILLELREVVRDGITTGDIDRLAEEQSLYKAIEAAVPGNFLSDVSAAIQTLADEHHFGIVREFCGHGIGRALHEDPPVLNYVQGAKGHKVKPGLVIAIEPMINLGTEKVRVLEDGWTVVTLDGRPSAHFEHTIAITPEGPEILTRV